MDRTSIRDRIVTTLFLAAALALAPHGAAAQDQTLQLANGDRLTGRLVRIADGAWIFRFGGAELRFAAGRVAAFTAQQQIGVRLVDGTIAAVTVAPVGGSQVQLTFEDGATRQVAPGDIEAVGDPANLRALEPIAIGLFTPFLRFWRAAGSLGFSDKSGNSRARGLSASVEVARRTRRDRLRFTLGLTREQSQAADGQFETTVSKYYGTARADLYLTARLFTFAETRQERDTFQDINLRSVYNAGFGVQLVSTEVTDVRFSASGGARAEHFTSGGSETVAVLNAGAGFGQRFGPAKFAWDLTWLPNVADFEDYQLRSDASLTTTLYKGLGVRLGLLNEFDSRPRPGVKRHDMLLTTTLTYSIGG